MTTDVLFFHPAENVGAAMQALVDRGVDGAPVVDDDEAVVGMISTGDLIVQESRMHFPTVISLLGATLELPSSKRSFEEDLRRTLGSTVADLMHDDPVTVLADATVEDAATLLHRHDISRLPVLGTDGRLVGIVARTDIVRAILADDPVA